MVDTMLSVHVKPSKIESTMCFPCSIFNIFITVDLLSDFNLVTQSYYFLLTNLSSPSVNIEISLSFANSKRKPTTKIMPSTQRGSGEYIVSMNSNVTDSAIRATPMNVEIGFSVICFIIN